MKIRSRKLLFGALALMLLASACSALTGTPSSPVGTILPTGQVTDTALPTGTATSNLTATPFIPITGMDVVSLQCQFCVNEDAHAVLIMSSEASFNVSDPATGITCLIAQEINGRRILLCRGAQRATFNLNVCVGESNCLQFPVTLQDCPLIPQTGPGTGTPFITFTPLTPIFLTPINTLIPEPSDTPGPPNATPTPTGNVPPPTSTTPTIPAATPTTQPATTEPPPLPTSTEPPAPTDTPAANPNTIVPTDEPTSNPTASE